MSSRNLLNVCIDMDKCSKEEIELLMCKADFSDQGGINTELRTRFELPHDRKEFDNVTHSQDLANVIFQLAVNILPKLGDKLDYINNPKLSPLKVQAREDQIKDIRKIFRKLIKDNGVEYVLD